jgi:transposase
MMLQITPQHRLWFALEPVDFRRGIDGLSALCRQQLKQDPFSGHWFIFRNRRGSAIKLLAYDGNGYWLCHKRFSTGTLKWWPTSIEQAQTIRAVELLLMLQQGNPQAASVPKNWRTLL